MMWSFFWDGGEGWVNALLLVLNIDGTNHYRCWGYLDNRAPPVSTKPSNNPFPLTLLSQTPCSVFSPSPNPVLPMML